MSCISWTMVSIKTFLHSFSRTRLVALQSTPVVHLPLFSTSSLTFNNWELLYSSLLSFVHGCTSLVGILWDVQYSEYTHVPPQKTKKDFWWVLLLLMLARPSLLLLLPRWPRLHLRFCPHALEFIRILLRFLFLRACINWGWLSLVIRINATTLGRC